MGIDLPRIGDWILTFGATHRYMVYAVIVLLACAEGPWLALIAGVLLRLSHFAALPVYLALMLGDLVGDAGWYEIGRRYGHGFIARYGVYINVSESGVERVTRLFRGHQNWVLFLSKISNGLGFAVLTLMTAGMAGVPFGQYMLVNLLGQVIWTGLLLSIGFFFAHLYVTVGSVLARMSILAGVIVLAVVGHRFWGYLRRHARTLGS